LFGGESYDAPVAEGTEYDVAIGIARVQGFVIFVPGTKVGDNVKIKVDKVMRRFAIASVAT